MGDGETVSEGGKARSLSIIAQPEVVDIIERYRSAMRVQRGISISVSRAANELIILGDAALGKPKRIAAKKSR